MAQSAKPSTSESPRLIWQATQVIRFKPQASQINILSSLNRLKNKSKKSKWSQDISTRSALTSSNGRIKPKTYRLCVPNLVPKKQLWDFPEHRKSFTSRSAKVITLIPSQKIQTTKGAKSNIFTCKQCDCISHTDWIFTVIIVIWTYEDLFSFVTSALSRGSFLLRSNNI